MLDLADIQGFVVRGYRMPKARHFVLEVGDARALKACLGELASPGGTPDGLAVTTATPWTEVERPDYALNLGFTFAGLRALEIQEPSALARSFRSFGAFREGAVARAGRVGDVAESAPEHWWCGLGEPDRVHAVVSLFARTGCVRDDLSEKLRAWLTREGAAVEVASFDGDALGAGDEVHFGYKDGIAQPRIAGGPARPADGQDEVPAHRFVLEDGPVASYYPPSPAPLGLNGSFAAFRILAQDVAAFEAFLATQPDPERMAAKICGRWRNGTPLVLSPDRPGPELPPEKLNDFDYRDDRSGARCPAGAHIRRTNPRDVPVLGGNTEAHRIIRRGLPFGPRFEPGDDPTIPRGLVGYFIGVDLANQFEFLMNSWIEEGGFTPALYFRRESRDPIFGDRDPNGGEFVIPTEGGGFERIRGFSRFVSTRGGAYVFLPSLTALRFIADAQPRGG